MIFNVSIFAALRLGDIALSPYPEITVGDYRMTEENAKTQGRYGAKETKTLSNSAPLYPCVKSENKISKEIVRCAIEAHRTLGGPGLLESVYEEALAWELTQAGLQVQRQIHVPIPYKGQTLASPLRIDLVVNGKVIIECKATTKFNEIFRAQTLTYLRLTGLKLGLVINFGERMVKDGIHRVVNGL